MPQLRLDDLEVLARGQGVPRRQEPAPAAAPVQDWTTARVRQQVAEEAQRQGVDPDLATSLTWQESRFRPNLTSPKGAYGPMQLMPGTANDLGVNPYDVPQNIAGGVRYLKQQLERFGGDQRLALAAYNAGPGAVERHGGVPPYQETQHYVRSILGTIGRALTPASAEAATGPATRLTPEMLEQRFGGAPASASPPSTAPVAQGAGRPPPPRTEKPVDLVIDIEKRSPDTAAPPAAPGSSLAGTIEPVTEGGVEQTLAARTTAPETPPPSAADTSRPQGPLSALPWWGKAALATGTSTLGAVGGAALGAMTGPAAPLAVPALEMGGSALARWLNVKLGVEDPGIVGDIASVALPGIFRGVGALTRHVVPRLPGAGVVRHEMAQEGLEALEGRLAPQVASDVLWPQAYRQGNPAVATLETWRTAGDILRTAQTAERTTASAPYRTLAEDFVDLSRRVGGPVPIEDLDRFRRTLQPHLGDPQVQRLYGAVLNDMEHAASRGVTGAGVMREAIATTRYEHALDDLARLWSPGVGVKTLEGDVTQVMGKQILDNFDKRIAQNPLFAQAFTAAERADIRETLQTVARLSAVSPATGGGLSGQVGRAAGTVVGGSAGGIPGAAAGWFAPEVMAAALRTAPGRAAIRQALAEGHGRLTQAGYALINSAVRQGLAATTTGHPPPGVSGQPGQFP